MITGRTSIIAHLGHPTEAFKAPMIYNPYFEEAGIDAVVVPMGVRAADYALFLKSLFRMTNILGALVTMPHKISSVALLDAISPAVEIAGSCNAVRRLADGRLEGEMFDGEGFARSACAKGIEIAGRKAVVVGTGGVGAAIAASLAGAGLARLALVDLDADKAQALASRLHRHYPSLAITTGDPDPAGADIVVNATPLGMKEDDPLPLDTDRLAPGTFVADVVMASAMTRFLKAAASRGCSVQIGTDMLFEQIPAYLAFFGLPACSAERLRELARIQY